MRNQFLLKTLSGLAFFSLSTTTLAANVPVYLGDTEYPIEQNVLILNNTDSVGDTALQFGRTLAKRLFWDNNGNGGSGIFSLNDGIVIGGVVGIGTELPSSILHIYENSSEAGSSAGMIIENEGTGDSILQFLLSSAQRWVVGIDNSDNDKFKIASSTDLISDTALTIETGGDVGIGDTSPDAQLDVEGGSVLFSAPNVASADGNFANSQISFWLDESNDEIELKAKKSDGAFINQTVGSGSSGGGSGDFAAVQARRTSTFDPPSSWVWYDLTMDVTDIENQTAVIDHDDNNTERILIKEDGLYQISYIVNHESNRNHGMDSRVMINNSVEIPGSYQTNYDYRYEYVPTSVSFVSMLSSGDYLTLQIRRTTTNYIQENAMITVIKMGY